MFADDEEPETVHTVTDDLVTPAQTEGQPVSTVASVRGQADIDGGVVGVRVHRVRAVTLQGGGKSGVQYSPKYDIPHFLHPHLPDILNFQ